MGCSDYIKKTVKEEEEERKQKRAPRTISTSCTLLILLPCIEMQSPLLLPFSSPSYVYPGKTPNTFLSDDTSMIRTSLRFTPSYPLKPTITSRSLLIRRSSPSPTITVEPTAEVETAPEEKFNWHSKWYPVALICELDKRAPHGLTVLGLDVVVWWDRGADRWQVFDDRCPHQLAPLSEGRIDQWGRLQCSYHGWCFDGSGGCKYIPQAPPDGPPVHTFNKACAAVYPSVVQNKILWFWPNTDPEYKDVLDKERPPYIAEMDDPSYACATFTRDYLVGYDFLIQNFMDPSHAPYAHYGLMQMPEPPRSSTDREGGMPIEINIHEVNADGFIARNHCQFIAPCVYHAAFNHHKFVDGSLYYPGTDGNTQAICEPKKRTVAVTFFVIPVSPGKSRVIWALQRNFALWMDELIPRWIVHTGSNLIVDSDIGLILQVERKAAEVGLDNWLKSCYLPTKSDLPVIAFRKWFRKYCNNEIDFGVRYTGLPPPPSKEQLLDRYHSHVVNCRSCHGALKVLRALEIVLQVAPIFVVGILAAAKGKLASTAMRTVIISMALGFFLASKWLAHFIYKTFYFHDWNYSSVSTGLLSDLHKLFI